MNQSKFSLADLLTVLGAIGFGFVCFLSMNFFTLGNTTQSITLALILAVLLGGIAFLTKLLKKTSHNFKTCFVWEVVLLILFVVIAFVGIYPFSHFFAVSDQKDEIRDKITASITQAENMFAGYESYAENREQLYKSKLKSVVNAKDVNPTDYANFGFIDNGVDDDKQIDNKMFTLHAKLFPTNYSDTLAKNGIKGVAITWLSDSKRILASPWSFNFGAIEITKDVEKNSQAWLSTLTGLSSVREKGEEAEDFNYDLSFDDVKTKFNTLDNPTPVSLGLAGLVYVLMLLSYFVSKRHTKNVKKKSTGEFTIEY